MANISTTITIQLANGAILAIQSNGITIARGVPYAEPKRFHPPQPVGKWNGILDCTRPAAMCPQRPSRLKFAMGDISKDRKADEATCLHVTVWSPTGHPASKRLLPVMAFLHGGAYLTGSGDLDAYSGSAISSLGVVVVNINYRLGIFGYQPIEGVAPANLGLLDQIEALKWIQGNIHSFGGDEANITLFGESAGADSIVHLMASDGVQGLFHRIILQSSPFMRQKTDRSALVASLSEVAKNMLANAKDTASSEELLCIQDQLLIAAKSLPGGSAAFGPLLNQHPLPDKSEFMIRLAQSYKRIPVLLGYNQDEGNAFAPIDSPMARSITNNFVLPAKETFHRINEGNGNAHLYEFNLTLQGNPLGAVHTTELAFLLGSWDDWKDAPMLSGSNSREIFERVSPEVKKMWAAFAKGCNLGQQRFVIDRTFQYNGQC
ncbi:hypothetical protein NQ176_g1056 [Zarea fungicola]|uniref:Uncharacterized protein n=1 Tax=Zarea fungicola TaxID=93591 RepID=A0ACC1NVI4_9HYPO|nr:hypothetical protein NQ176_g1056 [Lecanicillium fungicola]